LGNLTFDTASIHVCIHCFCSSFNSSHSFNCWKQVYAVWIRRREWSLLLFNPLNKTKTYQKFKLVLFNTLIDDCLRIDHHAIWLFFAVLILLVNTKKCLESFIRMFSRFIYGYFTLHFNKTLSIWIDIFYRFISNLTCLKYIIKSDKFIEFCSSILDEHI
jgi:hypothetical protein